jgi:outer membrane protein assembly factor BamB
MSRLVFWGCLAVVFVALPITLAAAGSNPAEPDWPRFRGPNGDGISPATGLLREWPKDGPALLWKSDPVGVGFSSVSMAGKRVFTMGDQKGPGDDKGACWVFGLDRDTGKQIWSTKVGKAGGNYSGPRCTPTVAGDLVYAIGQHGDLVCLEAATGHEKWRKNFGKDFGGNSGGWNYTESPLVDGDRLICTPGGREKGAIVALDRKTGALLWEADFGEKAGYASIVITQAGGVRQYVQLLSQGVAGVSAQDGKLLWRFRDKAGKQSYFAGNTANIPNAVALGDYIFAGAGYGTGAGLMKLVADGSAVKEEWIYFKQNLENRHGGYVVLGDYVCANWKTGAIQWQRDGDYKGDGSVSIVYADGRLYMHYANGYVALVEANPKMYAEHGVFKIPNATRDSWSHPVVVGGKLYLREQEAVWCYDVAAK